jgi:hypothetical protein
MRMLERRVQILLDRDRHDRLLGESRRRGQPVAALIREAIDATFPPSVRDRSAAARRILAAPPMPVPDPDALRKELDEIRGRRG